MNLPEPVPGLVIRYAYLWRREEANGYEDGTKDRPCAVVLATMTGEGRHRVLVSAITHTPPSDGTDAIELPSAVKQHLGLDELRSWIVLDEVNQFFWPGPDLRPVPGKAPRTIVYGMLPPRLLAIIRDRLVQRYRDNTLTFVKRTE